VRRSDDFEAALSAIEGEIYQVKLQSSQDPLNFPIKLNNKIARCSASSKAPTSSERAGPIRCSARSRTASTNSSEAGHGVKTKMPPINQLLQRQKARADQGGAAKVEAAKTSSSPPQ